ncbi:MAG TPA: MFS transporter [Dysgonomonas sp.]|uniref:MFS transporter n=2 Tax=Dysgonomonas TaxID=156973 RepID=A0A4Y9INI8_9BACT|nr:MULTISPECIES: MFS transporter [Dysgonomonas]MBF0760526.1 MFS transporter [Dysgonomonas mossii]TFU89498.1 MFS transporter [Dysgonomonas mossii]HML64483.1 MFS transporter [Dysgonomonas sp.]
MNTGKTKMTNYRWTICLMLFFATTINYLDRQVLSLTWDEFIKPEFHWDENHYGTITSMFSFIYAVCMLFAGRFIDWMGSKKGFLWAIGVWSVGACLHAVCGLVTEAHVGLHSAAELAAATGDVAVVIATFSMYCFLLARCILALGEAGNFPAAIKVTAEYFPKKDRAYATSIFNAGASIGALVAPLSIPLLAKCWGWEMAFIVIGALGFIWMGFWIFIYDAPAKSKHVNEAELTYIEQDRNEEGIIDTGKAEDEKKIPFWKCFSYKQTWAFAAGKFMTDGVWWFFLFWTPSYLNTQFGIKTSEGLGIALIFTLYAITMLSVLGGKLPTIIMNRTGMNPYAARMRAMLIFAFFPLVVLFAQPLGTISPWLPVITIGIGCAAHQSWSANIFSTIGDMFPKGAIASITGIGGMAGGISSMILQKSAGKLFVYSDEVQLTFMGFEGKPAGYFIIFCICAFAYLIGWVIMKSLVPHYKPITDL